MKNPRNGVQQSVLINPPGDSDTHRSLRTSGLDNCDLIPGAEEGFNPADCLNNNKKHLSNIESLLKVKKGPWKKYKEQMKSKRHMNVE